MLVVKFFIYMCIFLTSATIGMLKSKKYSDRVDELKEFKNALNIFKTKIKFTYEPIPEIFRQISESLNSETGEIFKIASNNMKELTAGESWNLAIESDILSINSEDREILKNLSKLLGQTNLEGQISQIELTSTFINEQINKAELEKAKNEKLYKTLGMIVGLAIVIILI